MKNKICVYAIVTLIAVIFTATNLNDYTDRKIRSAIFDTKEPVLEETVVIVDPLEGGER